jgi:site-specific recombinase XerD
LIKFQDALLKTGIRPQSVNNKMKAVRRLFEKLARQNVIENSPCDFVKRLAVLKKRTENRAAVTSWKE